MTIFDLSKIEKEIKEIDEEMLAPDFWNDRKRAQDLINRQNKIRNIRDVHQRLSIDIQNFCDELGLLKEEYNVEMHALLEEEFLKLSKEIKNFEMQVLLTGEYDDADAIIEIHPGAGGTESQDWAEMLYRMYVLYAEKKKYKIETLDYQIGDEAGIKSVSFIIKGANAYGYLKGEKGVHRLVRISPFDASGRRHTSFASVDVIPQINNNIDIQIDEGDLKIDTYRASGAGGQHINKTDSAVRITHIPTGIVVSCQSQRSQIQNKEQALLALKSKLYQRSVEERNKEIDKLRGEQKAIEWGSQIRSYVFCPYCLVKDHRTDYQTADSDGVMNGDLDQFIYSYLKARF